MLKGWILQTSCTKQMMDIGQFLLKINEKLIFI